MANKHRRAKKTSNGQRDVTEDELEGLVKRAQDGDKDAQSQILEDFRSYMKRKASIERKRLGLIEGSTSVIVQEAGTDIFLSFASHEWKGAAYFRGWLALATRGAASDMAKAERAEKRGGKDKNQTHTEEDVQSDIDTFELVSQWECQNRIRELAIQHLTEEQALVIDLQLGNGPFTAMHPHSIAQKLGKSEEAVRKMTERAVEVLITKWDGPTAEEKGPEILENGDEIYQRTRSGWTVAKQRERKPTPPASPDTELQASPSSPSPTESE